MSFFERFFLVFIGAVALAAVVWAFVAHTAQADHFKQECEQIGGKPVFNSRNWECFR